MGRPVFLFFILLGLVPLACFSADTDYLISMKIPSGFSDMEVSTAELDTSAGTKIQTTHVTEGPDAIIVISVTDTGFTEESEAQMMEGLSYAMMEYTMAYRQLSEGKRRINGYLFKTGSFTFNQDETDLYVDVYLTHIGTKQILIQILADSRKRLRQPDLQTAVDTFTYIEKR